MSDRSTATESQFTFRSILVALVATLCLAMLWATALRAESPEETETPDETDVTLDSIDVVGSY